MSCCGGGDKKEPKATVAAASKAADPVSAGDVELTDKQAASAAVVSTQPQPAAPVPTSISSVALKAGAPAGDGAEEDESTGFYNVSDIVAPAPPPRKASVSASPEKPSKELPRVAEETEAPKASAAAGGGGGDSASAGTGAGDGEGEEAPVRRQRDEEDRPRQKGLTEVEMGDFDDFGHWELEKSNIDLDNRIGRGEFGEVWGGILHGTGEFAGYKAKVAVKLLKRSEKTRELLEEARLMIGLHHKNILKIYGVVSKDEPVYIITEMMDLGSLLTLLESPRGQALSLKKLMKFSRDVVAGMTYMQNVRCIHRDLACRNILINEDWECKIGDFGLAAFLEDDQEDIHMPNSFQFPVRWTAPEVILEHRYCLKSDVWSFGVTFYEIITWGSRPYDEATNKQVTEGVLAGMRLPCPIGCPKVLHNIMMECWQADPNDRPDFEEIDAKLAAITDEELQAEE